jgi:hypothetical protein
VAAFAGMLAFWTVVVTICFKNQPKEIEVPVRHVMPG